MYDIEASSSPYDMINCARFYFYVNDYEKYEELIEKTNDMNFETGEDLIVKGWRDCFSNDENMIVKNYIKMF
jgi:hypothetical protein